MTVMLHQDNMANNIISLHPEQKRALQSMAPEEKLGVSMNLYYGARELKRAWLREMNPAWSEKQVEEKVRELFRHAGTRSI